MHPQLGSAHSYIQLTAAQRRAVLCCALPCRAVLFHAALCFLSNMQRSTRYMMRSASYQLPVRTTYFQSQLSPYAEKRS